MASRSKRTVVVVDDSDLSDIDDHKVVTSLPADLPLSLPKSLKLTAMAAGFGGTLTRGHGWTNWIVRLSNVTIHTASGGGNITYAAAASPAIVSYSGYPSISPLFDEVKCVALELQVVPKATYAPPTSGSNTTSTVVPVLACGSLISSSASPASLADVCSAQDARLVNWLTTESLGHIHHSKYPKDLAFAAVGTPAPGPYAGCPGSIRLYGQDFAANAVHLATKVTATFHFRGRV